MAPFGKSNRKGLLNQTACDHHVGPGNYDVTYGDIEINLEKNPGVTVHTKTNNFKASLSRESPGPCAYFDAEPGRKRILVNAQ
jgi:hypothetical protein